MVSKEFKKLVAALKKAGGIAYDTPYSILIDKETGEAKQGAKNIQALELAKLFNELPQEEQNFILNHRGAQPMPELLQYVQTEFNNTNIRNLYMFDKIGDLYKDFTYKQREFAKKKEREDKKKAVATAKATAAASLTRKDVADVIKRISSQMEPYIKAGEDKIKDGIVKIAERVRDDYKRDVIDWAKKEHGMVDVPKRIYDYVKLKDGSQVSFSGLFNNSPFMDKYYDPKKSYRTRLLKPNIQIFIDGKEKELYERAMKMFRDGEEFKVSVLFHRLFKSNPTLVAYEMLRPYDGDEFTIGAKNEKGEKIVIQTNTITAGGYNIQRLHTRWLVSVRNSTTGKTEKFTIDDKAKA